jgi:hypothetical protein
MYYKDNERPELALESFRDPGREYRGAPFWAWNCKLTDELLDKQVPVFREMGFGGFYMHVRTGLDTAYLGRDFFEKIKRSVALAKENDLLALLYDEDRWPSGAAGGLVTRDKKYRGRLVRFTPRLTQADRAELGHDKELLACYDIALNADGSLDRYSRIEPGDPARGAKWYALFEIRPTDTWYNGGTYVDTLSKEAIDRFIDVTYRAYKENLQGDFGETARTIFTDEPQFCCHSVLPDAFSEADATLPWTFGLGEDFQKRYREDLIAHLPELIWELPNGKISRIRYHYHDYVTERFVSAFSDTCGTWCKNNGISFTGHVKDEPTLLSQTGKVGEAMRFYRSMEFPGIDILCGDFEYTTARQAQSAVRQLGREGMMSELYGVTGWHFDFRDYKLHGDWQAAMGVTMRVPHLSWMSMEGEAKRDYPASIFYQSPWYREFPYIEDHFARVNTAMTRGKALVKVGVIHPIESYWLHNGPLRQTMLQRESIEKPFSDLTEWLLFGGIDFDFISEALLPELCAEGSAPFRVGASSYDVIVLPFCETLRSTTLRRLEEFSSSGGRILALGPAPYLVDGESDDSLEDFETRLTPLPFSRPAILARLHEHRLVELVNGKGEHTPNLLHQLRRDGDSEWLFVAHGKEPYNRDIPSRQDILIRVKGEFSPALYDTMSGEIKAVNSYVEDHWTVIPYSLYDYDSILVKLEPRRDRGPTNGETQAVEYEEAKRIPVPNKVRVTLSEPNALLLDRARIRLDNKAYGDPEELIRADDSCRNKLGWPHREGRLPQPWTEGEGEDRHSVTMCFCIRSELTLANLELAVENLKDTRVSLNGEAVKPDVSGWFTDYAIQKVKLPPIREGDNELVVQTPFTRRKGLEWCYLLGDFGVRVEGRENVLTAPVRELHFGDITEQGLPYYGGNITYHVEFEEVGMLRIEANQYRGALLKAMIDGGDEAFLTLPPNRYTTEVKAGRHRLDLLLFGNRANCFGQVHLCDSQMTWLDPASYRTTGSAWSDEYRLKPLGILTTPLIAKMRAVDRK